MPTAVSSKLFAAALVFGLIALLIIPVNTVGLFKGWGDTTFFALAYLQLALGMTSALCSLVQFFRAKGLEGRGWTLALAFGAMLVGLGGPFGILLVLAAAWGRA